MKKAICIVISVAAAAGLLYLEGASVFAGRFPLQTTLNGEDVSFQKISDVVSDASGQSGENYTLTITDKNAQSTVITGDAISLRQTAQSDLSTLVSDGKNYSWLSESLTKTDLTSDTSVVFDQQALQDQVIAFVGDDESIDQNKAFSVIEEAVTSLLPAVSLEDAGCYNEQQVTIADASLSMDAQTIEEIQPFSISLNFNGTTETIGSDTIMSWITQDADGLKIDEASVSDYVQSLASKYNTTYQTRSFTTSLGNVVSIPAGTYGWSLDKSSTSAAIINAMMQKQAASIDPVWTTTASQFGEKDWGNSYVEIDLTNQHVYVYKDGSLVVETDCVTGKLTNGNGTPAGAFYIVFKQKDAVLRGEGYETPVSYWMPFYLGVGLHDASWRGSFGGTIYATAGSHGCVNLPPAKAAQVYNAVYSGMPVFVYGGMSMSEAQQIAANAAAAQAAEEAAAQEAANTAELEAQQEIIDQAISNYMTTTGMTEEQAKAQVEADLAAQAAAAQAAAQEAANAAAAEQQTVTETPAADATTDATATQTTDTAAAVDDSASIAVDATAPVTE